jgi:hypothetical protein
MEVFFYKYRKILIAASVFSFLYFFYELYMGIESINSNNTGKGTGTLIDACISLFLAVYFFVNVRKVKRDFKAESAAAETKTDNGREA